MQAEIICIGDELLIGQTVNTNSAWLGAHLNAIGIRVHRSTSIADNTDEIISALDEAAGRSQVILLTGGLGPTKDDITKNTLCTYFNTGLKVNDEAFQRITQFFVSRGLPLLELNTQQAALPEACTVIQNYRGTACGMWFERNGVVFISMPGVPYEMEAMMENEVLLKLQTSFSRPHITHRTVLTVGTGESFIARKIADWEQSLAEHKIHLAYLPSPGMVKLRMSVYEGELEAQVLSVANKEKELMSLIGEYVYGYEKDTLEGIVGELLRNSSFSLAIAESCTGGYLSQLITSVPGSSDYFAGSMVTYAAANKELELGISLDFIAEHNVVSSSVAEAMAAGVRKKYKTSFGLATTGISGPSGGTEEIPVGSVWIAVASSKGVKSVLFKFGNRRELNTLMASNAALNMLRKEILNGIG